MRDELSVQDGLIFKGEGVVVPKAARSGLLKSIHNSSVYIIKKLKGHFARHGIPEQLLTDNGPQFVSRNFLKFSKEWDFEHRTSSRYHSQSNGKAESAVKQAKKILLKCSETGSDAFLALLDHRNTPPASMQISSAQRLFSRRTRSLLPMTAAL